MPATQEEKNENRFVGFETQDLGSLTSGRKGQTDIDTAWVKKTHPHTDIHAKVYLAPTQSWKKSFRYSLREPKAKIWSNKKFDGEMREKFKLNKVQNVLTYFQPSIVLQHSQKMSATAWRPVSRTRSSAGPQPTFTLKKS